MLDAQVKRMLADEKSKNFLENFPGQWLQLRKLAGVNPDKDLFPGFDDTLWFRMNIGRRHNADPRWLLPLLCRRGHITRNEIGAIRIAADQTMFEIPRAVAGRFVAALKRTAADDPDGEGSVRFEPVQGSPREEARGNRRSGPPARKYEPKPYRPKAARRRG